MGAAEKILLVDDEQNLLSGLRRQFRGRYDIVTAASGNEALEKVRREGPFAVVVSDMRMPGMDGVQTLEAIGKESPITVRMMLTGNADQDTAVRAINSGRIFRFFNKPCDGEQLAVGLDAGLQQYRLQNAEKELLEHTLAGSVKLLNDVLALSNAAFAHRTTAKRGWAKKVAKALALPRAWELDLAVMLAPIGLIGVPAETVSKWQAGVTLSGEEKRLIDSHPENARNLVVNIPRMENVAKAILYQNKNFDGTGFPADDLAGETIPVIARILKVLGAIAELTDGHAPSKAIFDKLKEQQGAFDPKVMSVARECLEHRFGGGGQAEDVAEHLPISLLRPGLILLSDITNAEGRLILSRGTELTEAQVQRLRGLKKTQSLSEPVQVIRHAVPA